MGESSTKKIEQYVEFEDLDETMPLETLDHLLEHGEPDSSEDRGSPQGFDQEPILSQLNKLAELSKSIDSRLETIASLLAKPEPARKPKATKPAATRNKVARKTVTKRPRKKAASRTG